MKRTSIIKKSVAILLTMLIALSSMSIIAVNATTIDDETTGTQTEDIKTEASVDDVKTEASSDIYKMWATTKYGLRFNSKYFPYKFKNQINGKTVTYPASWGAIEYEYAHNSKGNTAAWCIQPGVVINNADYSKITVDENGKITNPAKAQTDYLKKLQKHPQLQNAIAKTIAYGKKNGATKSDSPYYYAVGLLIWDYVMNNRYTKYPYSVKDNKTSNLYKIYNTVDNSRVLGVQEAAKDILKQMKKEKEPIKSYKELGDKQTNKLYSSIKEAKAVRTQKRHNVQLPKNPNSKGVYTEKSQAKFSSLMKRNDINYTVVNQNDNITNFTKKISVTLNKQGKLQVTTKENLYNRALKGNTYYIKITKTPKDYKSSNSTIMFDSLADVRQSFVNTLPYKADKVTAYFPIYHRDIDEPGSLIINKKVTSNIDNSDITGLLSGWTFKVEYKVNGQNITTIKTTNSEGATTSIDDIPEGTTVTITELGKPVSVQSNQWYNYQQFAGTTYAMPIAYTDKTSGSTKGNIKSTTVKITSSEQVDFEYVNEYKQDFKLRIKKETSDGDDVSGYYFGIWDFKKEVKENTLGETAHSKVIKTPKLLGPTDKDGYAYCYLDNINKTYLKNSEIYVIELGKLNGTAPEPSTTELELDANGMVPAFYDNTSDPASRFSIPVKYKLTNDTIAYDKTGSALATPISIYFNDIKEFYENPDTFTKTFTVVNKAEGMVKLKKKCEKTGKDLGNAVYGIFEYHQNDGEDDYKGEYDEEGGDSYNEEEQPEATEPQANDPTTSIEDEINLENQDDTITWEVGRIGINEGTDVNDNTALSGIYRRTGYIGTDTFSVINVSVKDTSKKVQWNLFWYDSDKNYISCLDFNNPPKISDSRAVKIPENAAFVRLEVHRGTSLGGINAIESDFLLNKVIVFTFDDAAEDTNLLNSDIPVSSNDDIKPLCTLTTKENEWVYSKGLPCGTYYIKELKAPSTAYTVDNTKYKFTIEPGMNTQATALPIVRADKPSEINFYKVDEKTVQGKSYDNAKLLAGAKINFYEKPSSGKLDYNSAPVVYTIDSTSKAKAESIVAVFEIGKTYIAHEVKAPKGYFLADDVEFTVSEDGSVDKVYMQDDPMELKISKKDITNSKELPGCDLQITDKNNSVIEKWTSTNEVHEVDCSKFTEGETYTLTETMSVDGYTKAESISFKIEKGMPTTITMEDAPTKLRFSKQGTTESEGIATTAEVPGCKLEVKTIDGEIVEAWTSTNEPHIIEGKLKINTNYYMNEISAAPGWKIAEPVKFHVDNTGKVQDVVMVDEPQPSVFFSKKSLTGNEELEGCKLEVRDANDKVVDSWISDKTPHVIANLVPGETYSMVETKPVDGYATAEKITFVVPKEPKALTITMKDAPTVLEFSKTSITGTKELPGCKLKITDEKGKTLYHWTSTNKPHIIKGKLAINKTYYLVETKPTDGYTTAENVKFTVKDTGEIQHVKMKDAPTVIKVKKVASHDTKLLLGGAKFKVTDVTTKKHKVVCRFTTKAGKPFIIKGKLIAGHKYEIKETKAPVGYNKAKSVTFKVKDTPKAQIITVKDSINIRFEVPQTGGLGKFLNYAIILILGLLGIGAITGGILYYRKKKAVQ